MKKNLVVLARKSRKWRMSPLKIGRRKYQGLPIFCVGIFLTSKVGVGFNMQFKVFVGLGVNEVFFGRGDD